MGEAGVGCEFSRLPQLRRRGRVRFCEGFVIRLRDQRAVVVPPHEGVKRAEGVNFGCGGFELGFGHVRGIEVGARRLVAHAVDERPIATKPIPWPVVDLDVLAGGVVPARQRERLVLVPVGFLPEDIFHGLGGLDQEAHDLLVVLGEVGKVGLEAEDGVLVDEGLHDGVGGGGGLVVCRDGAS